MVINEEISRKARYRLVRKHDPDMLENVFDGSHFQQLSERDVTWAGDRPAGSTLIKLRTLLSGLGRMEYLYASGGCWTVGHQC
jgi:hypothetical protein